VISRSWESKRGGLRLRGRKLPSGISGKYSWASGSEVLIVRDLADLSLLSFFVGVVKEDLPRRGRGVGALPNSSAPLRVWDGLEVDVVLALEKREGIERGRGRREKRRKDWSRFGGRQKRPHSESSRSKYYSMRRLALRKLSVISVHRAKWYQGRIIAARNGFIV
jgi:hypothetical protein